VVTCPVAICPDAQPDACPRYACPRRARGLFVGVSEATGEADYVSTVSYALAATSHSSCPR
jgi:hypothetical protein